MINRRYSKERFATMLVLSLAMTTLKVFLESRNLEKRPNNNLEEYSKYFAETHESTNTTDVNHHLNQIPTSLNKPSTISKCGYDVSYSPLCFLLSYIIWLN